MALINVNVDSNLLKRLVTCLERLADAADRAYPPMGMIPMGPDPKDPNALFQFDPEAEWEKQQEDERRHAAGYNRT